MPKRFWLPKGESVTEVLNAVYFPTAVTLGALHALEPGHAKALTAAYLIGIKGTKRDSVLLGLSVAATHSIVVIGISAVALFIGNEAFAGDAAKWLEVASGGVAITVGIWMLQRRLRAQARMRTHGSLQHAAAPVEPEVGGISGPFRKVATPVGEPSKGTFIQSTHFTKTEAGHRDHDHSSHGNHHGHAHAHGRLQRATHGHGEHDHSDMTVDEHARAHAATLPAYVEAGERPTALQIMAFGAAGGMIPCPASITVMLLALATGRGAMGFATVLGFSLGLALALVGIGVLVVTGLSRLPSGGTGRVAWISKRAPVISACFVILSGLYALFIARHGQG